VQNYTCAVSQVAQTSLRSVIGQIARIRLTASRHRLTASFNGAPKGPATRLTPARGLAVADAGVVHVRGQART
jgi:hypothetical protein